MRAKTKMNHKLEIKGIGNSELTWRSSKSPLSSRSSRNISKKTIINQENKWAATTINSGFGCNSPGFVKLSSMSTPLWSNSAFLDLSISCLLLGSSLSSSKFSKLREMQKKAKWEYLHKRKLRYCLWSIRLLNLSCSSIRNMQSKMVSTIPYV